MILRRRPTLRAARLALSGAAFLGLSSCGEDPTGPGRAFAGRPYLSGVVTSVAPATERAMLTVFVQPEPGGTVYCGENWKQVNAYVTVAPEGARPTALRWASGQPAAAADLVVGRRVEVWPWVVDGLLVCPGSLHASGLRLSAAP